MIHFYPLAKQVRTLVLATLFFSAAVAANAQTQIYLETFPNSFNTNFNRPLATTNFTGSEGVWTGYSNDDNATIVVNDVRKLSNPYALKIVSFSNDNSAVSTCIATAPNKNLSSYGTNQLTLTWNMLSYKVLSNNTGFCLFLEVSSNGGTSWTTVWSKTAQQLSQLLPNDTWTGGFSATIPISCNTSTFKYRFRGANPAHNLFDTWIFIDDIKIFTNSCNCSNLKLGDRVFNDVDNSGYREDDEGGIAGVTVNLYKDNNDDDIADGASIATTTTDADGFYVFAGLAAGNYLVGVVKPAGFGIGTVNGGDPDNNIDRDNNGEFAVGNEIRTQSIILTNGDEPQESGVYNNTLDVGCVPLVNVGGKAFQDHNNNGLLDAGVDGGIGGATVYLYLDANNDNIADGGAIATTTTAATTGAYNFPNLYPNNYIVGIVLNGYLISSTSGGDPDAVTTANDNNGEIAVGATEVRSKAVTVLSGTEPTDDGDGANGNLTVGFGLYKKITLGNNIWDDQNANGLKDANESGAGFFTVYLYADANQDNVPDGAAIQTTTTNGTGVYSFTNINPGYYIVGVLLKNSSTKVAANAGEPDNNVDNDNNGVTLASGIVRTNNIYLTSGDEPTSGYTNNTLDIALNIPSQGPLPLSLLTFTGNYASSVANLQWTVTNESTLAAYTIERSRDGVNFEAVGTLQAQNSVAKIAYTLADNLAGYTSNVVMYRLIMHEKSGDYKYSNIITMKLNNVVKGMQLSPNPARSFTNLSFASTESAVATISVYNAAGHQVISRKQQIAKGNNTVLLSDLQNLSKGVYVVQAQFGATTFSSRIVLQ